MKSPLPTDINLCVMSMFSLSRVNNNIWSVTVQAYQEEEQGMYRGRGRWVHPPAAWGETPPISHFNRCASPSKPSKQEIHTARNQRGEGGVCWGGKNSNYEGWVSRVTVLFHFERRLLQKCMHIQEQWLVPHCVGGKRLHRYGSTDLFLNYPPLGCILCQGRVRREKWKRERLKEKKREQASQR